MMNKILSILKKEMVNFLIYSTNFVLLVLFIIFLNLFFIFLTSRNYENISVGMPLFAFLSYLFIYHKFSTLVIKNNDKKGFFTSLTPLFFIFIISVISFFITCSTELSSFIALSLLLLYLMFLFLRKRNK